MPALFDFLYQEYCRSRLAEMRKQLLLSAQVPEACDADDVVDSADQDDGLGGDSITVQHETRLH